MSNRDRIGEMLALIDGAVGPFVEKTLKSGYGANWRQHARLPQSLSPMAELDAYAQLYAIIHNWRDIFNAKLKPELRDAASAALAGRNAYAHSTSKMDNSITLRALSGGVDLLTAVGAKQEVKKAQSLLDDLLKEMTKETKANGGGEKKRPKLTLKSQEPDAAPATQEDFFEGGEVEGLKPWRIVSPPREDVLTGRLDKDNFAANLAAADRADKDSDATYSDPIEFFNATYLTNGLQVTLENAAKRLRGEGGPSTIGLQTNFGGGKTHTLLSLLHMAKLQDLSKVETLKPLVDTIESSNLGDVRHAVFSGSDKAPDQPFATEGGKAIRTLWGYLAWRLMGREGLSIVEASEDAGTSPGAEVFQKILRAGDKPALILLDELVVFIRQLTGERYEAHLSFLQSLTEAASQVQNALIVGSLPESDLEAGAEKGKDTLRALEKLFGRTQSAWQPAQGSETYSVVRRRLFQELDEQGEKDRKRTVERFRKLYKDHKGDFPAHVSEAEYAEMMRQSYPIHPMLFDKLSSEWGTLENFQRTRGVLSLLARTIYASYRERSDEPLILPSSLRIDDHSVRGALLEPLSGPVWGSIIDSEVDGDRSLPVEMELKRQRYGKDNVATRAARAVFVCTAPAASARGGVTGPELRLACVRPGDQVSIYGDALREIAERSAHLYESEGRYWYAPQPTLNKLAENRQLDIDNDQADAAIVDLLKADERAKGQWGRVHTAPDRASEIEDRPTSGLVVLSPRHLFTTGGGSAAETEALDGLERRAGGQRKYRNALVYLATDERLLDAARRAVKRLLAWKSIKSDTSIPTNDSQKLDIQNRVDQADRAAKDAVRKSWAHLLIPVQSIDDESVTELEHHQMRPNGQRTPAEAAWEKTSEISAIATQIGPKTFSERLIELWPADNDDLAVDQIRDWYFEYLHMPRLRDEVVLAGAISDAAADTDDAVAAFAVAAGKSGDEYLELQLSKRVPVRFGSDMLLVRREVVRIGDPDAPTTSDGSDGEATDEGGESPRGDGATPASPSKGSRSFTGIIELDTIRGPVRASQVFENIIAELDRAEDVSFRITLEIQADANSEFPGDVESVVSDNAKTLGFTVARFEK